MNLLHASKVFFKQNGSTILTCLGAIGVAATSIAAVKATPKAIKLLEKTKEEKGEDLTVLEKVKVAGPAYIPAAVIGTSTIACIFGANILNKRQQGSLVSAYALLDNAHKEYKKKVKELYGEESDANVRSEIAKDKYNEVDVPAEDGKTLFFDNFSMRYFESTTENVLWAEYELNRMVSMYGGASLADFYDLLGISHEVCGYEDLGWTSGTLEAIHWTHWIDFEHDKAVMDDGLEITIINMVQEPITGFLDY